MSWGQSTEEEGGLWDISIKLQGKSMMTTSQRWRCWKPQVHTDIRTAAEWLDFMASVVLSNCIKVSTEPGPGNREQGKWKHNNGCAWSLLFLKRVSHFSWITLLGCSRHFSNSRFMQMLYFRKSDLSKTQFNHSPSFPLWESVFETHSQLFVFYKICLLSFFISRVMLV